MADLVFRGGNVLTLDAASRRASAVAVTGDRITYVGDNADAQITPATRVVELKGRTLMPGLTDGHAHLDREGLKGLLPSLSGCRSIREIVERVHALAAATPPGQWIVTMPIGEPPEFGWSEKMFEEGRLPNRADLDRASTKHPILIRSAWGYWSGDLPMVCFANSAALAAAGVRKSSASPSPLLEVEVDASGEPTGIFREKTFQPLAEFTLFRMAPQFNAGDRARTLAESMRLYNAVGTTAVFEGHGVAEEVISAYDGLRASGRQTVRATLAFSPGWSGASEADVRDWVAQQAPALRGKGKGDAWLRVAGFFAEPEVAPKEARLRAQCRPQTGWAGFNYDQGLPRETLVALLRAAAKEKLRVCAIQAPMLDVFLEAAREAPVSDLRWVIAHPITLDSAQVAKIRDLGVCVTTHTNNYLWKRASEVRNRVGRDKEETICPIRALLDAKVCVSLATDNVPISLWPCVWQAVERIDRATGEVIAPGQRISREEALRCATTQGAYLCLDEDERGTIEAGRLADLIVLPEDPLKMPAEEIPALKPDLTMVGGRVAWSANAAR